MKDVREMSNAFDIAYNNITSNQAPGLSEWEKSVFLTRAQNELVRNWVSSNSKGNSLGEGFDDSAIRQMDFLPLMKTGMIEHEKDSTPSIDPRALVYKLPVDILVITGEQIYLMTGDNAITVRQVVPLRYQEYMRLMSKPFKEPLKSQAWRLMNTTRSNETVEIVLSSVDKEYPTIKYVVRYVKSPKPIILEELHDYGNDVSIENEHEPSLGELGEGTHDAIVQRAVELAKIAWNGDAGETQVQMVSGQRSD